MSTERRWPDLIGERARRLLEEDNLLGTPTMRQIVREMGEKQDTGWAVEMVETDEGEEEG